MLKIKIVFNHTLTIFFICVLSLIDPNHSYFLLPYAPHWNKDLKSSVEMLIIIFIFDIIFLTWDRNPLSLSISSTLIPAHLYDHLDFSKKKKMLQILTFEFFIKTRQRTFS